MNKINIKSTLTNLKKPQEQEQEQQQLFYLSNYRYGGCTTFTGHLLHSIKKQYVLCLTKAFEKDIGEFGYGIKYKKRSIESLDHIKKMFIIDSFKTFIFLKR